MHDEVLYISLWHHQLSRAVIHEQGTLVWQSVWINSFIPSRLALCKANHIIFCLYCFLWSSPKESFWLEGTTFRFAISHFPYSCITLYIINANRKETCGTNIKKNRNLILNIVNKKSMLKSVLYTQRRLWTCH